MDNKYLNILLNGEIVEKPSEFILFPDYFDGEFKASTYSVSPNIITEFKQFETISLIVGIKNDKYQANVINKINYQNNVNNILNLKSVDFMNNLDDESKIKIINKTIKIYSPTYPIHTKLFILSNKNKSKNRVILGSANLTNTALNTNIAQFEDIIIFDDNDAIFEIYNNRFELLKKHTINYIPNAIMNKLSISNINNKSKKSLSDKSNINVIAIANVDNDLINKADFIIDANELNKIEKPLFTPISLKNDGKENEQDDFFAPLEPTIDLNDENNFIKNIIDEYNNSEIKNSSFISLNSIEEEEIIIEALNELNNTIDTKIAEEILPKDILSNIKNESSDFLINYNNRNIDIQRDYKLIKDMISIPPKKNLPLKFEKSPSKISKVIKQTLQVKMIETEKEAHLTRLNISRLDNHVSYEQIEGNVIQITNDNIVKPYSQFTNKEVIVKSLKNIDNIIRGYQNYLSKYDNEIGKKIFEVILYSFTSPFMSLIRKSLHTNEERQNIPMFLFIGGIGGSGKSSLLRCISKMMNDDYSIKAFIDYDRISLHKTASSRTNETIIIIKNLLSENNVFPIMIDEIPAKFFENNTIGEHIIVHTSNTIDDMTMDYPTFIGTTNCSNYSMDERATRRSYYIKLDIPFRENKRTESSIHYNDLIKELNTSLFKDFLARFHQKMLDKNIKYTYADENGLLDFLVVSREIFKEYYDIAEMTLPSYFSHNRLNDYRLSGKIKWLSLFKAEYNNSDIFTYNKKDKVLYFTPHELDKNQKNYQERRAMSYIKALPNSMSTSDENSYNITINADEFFDWIGIQNPYKINIPFFNKNQNIKH